MRKFNFEITADGNYLGDGIIEIDQKVFDEVNSEEWQEAFCKIISDEDIAAYVASHVVVHNNVFGYEEPFYGLESSLVRVVEYPIGWDEFRVTAKELE